MTFLQPNILWALPLVLVPVIIHLINRLRHKPQPWAAMMFLVAASQASTSHAKLRQLLVLLFRVLAVFALILFLSRPLAGGWLGWAMAAAPDVILLVLDRSASMETKPGDGQPTRREQALRLFAEGAKPFERTSRLVLLDSATRGVQEVASAENLREISAASASDTAADFPAMLQTALDWIARTKPGTVEVWLASDLQRSNWQPESERWTALAAQFAALPQGARLRLLALNQQGTANNTAVSVAELNRRAGAQATELDLVLQFDRNTAAPAKVPLTLTLDGRVSTIEVPLEGAETRYRHRLVLDSATAAGWGKVELPADANRRDNTAFFVYGPPPALRTVVVAADGASGKFLKFAAAPVLADTNRVAEIFAPERFGNVALPETALVLWHAPLPTGAVVEKLRLFAEAGGAVLFFAAGEAGRFENSGFGQLESAAEDKPWAITKWDEKEGPLARTEEGLNLPLAELVIAKRQAITGEPGAVALFNDGGPWLTRRNVGKGQMLFCATALAPEWSSFAEGTVLVPLVQRLLLAGSRRFTESALLACGETVFGAGESWTPVDAASPKDLRLEAGVYRSGARLVAVNRPARESDAEVLESERARQLFGKISVHLFDEARQGSAGLQSELWRFFLLAMGAFLLLEAILILPPKNPATTAATTTPEARTA